MTKKIFQWLGREFVALSGEGKSGGTATDQMQGIVRRFDEELRSVGLSLENTVRTRLWAVDRDSRHQASNVRFKMLSGKARASSTSFLSQDHFDSDARVSLDLIALRPSQPGVEKKIVEYDPPKRPCRYVIYDAFVFLTGEEAETALEPPVLADQLVNILSLLGDSLTHAGASWDRAIKVSSFLHRSQKLANYKEHLKKM